jgi:hypothetical protein
LPQLHRDVPEDIRHISHLPGGSFDSVGSIDDSISSTSFEKPRRVYLWIKGLYGA